MQSPHPDDQTLKAYGLGKLVDEQASTVDEHLESCADCRQRISGLTSDSFLGRFREGHQPSARSVPGGSLADGTLSFIQAKVVSPPPATDTLPPGLANHPDYEIKRELGRGGMGVVYLAHNSMMGRDEVLKVIGRQIMERPGVLERFQREIRAVAKLRHPNIVVAHSAFRIEGGLVFAMEYVEGLDLSRLVKAKGPLSVSYATYFIHQAALGLQHAHEKGLIHRDIKPQNLMLTHDGKARLVKVLDFGLAKATREEKVDGGLTSEGQALGTPDYIAPEQIVNALDVDIRADLYSLGGTLFYLLTGRPPFQAASLYDLYQAHMSRDTEPLNLIRPEVPAELAALVAKMMAKEPRKRFQTPGEIAEALRPFFRKAGALPSIPTSNNSQVGQASGGRSDSGAASPSTQPATDAYKPSNRGEKATRRTIHQAGSESVIDVQPSAPSINATSPEKASPPTRWNWKIIAAASTFGMLMFGIVIIVIINNNRSNRIVINPGLPTGIPVDQVARSKDQEIRIDPVHEVPSPSPSKPVAEPSARIQAEGSRPVVTETIPPAISEGPSANQLAATAPVEVAPAVKPVIWGIKPLEVSTNSIKMKFVLIPPGNFMMGASNSDLLAEDYEKPQHPVTFKNPFYLGVYEVTQGQFREIMDGVGPTEFLGDDFPALDFWKEATLFCNLLSEQEGLQPYYRFVGAGETGGEGYRLPTEIEWEYACRASSKTHYPFGDKPRDLEQFAWYKSNSRGKYHPVGQKSPNKWGLFDMLGNAQEQCDISYKTRNPPVPGLIDLTESGKEIVRGGEIDSEARNCRSSSTGSSARNGIFGFRLARDFRPANSSNRVAASTRKQDSSKNPASSTLRILPPTPRIETNSIEMKLAVIPSGEFLMGSPDSDLYAEMSEKPQHRVRIASPFLLGVHEVTVRQFRHVLGEEVRESDQPDYPIAGVAWKEAIHFCNELSDLEKLTRYYRLDDDKGPEFGGNGYRLPTEAEWEYACRACSTSRYYFGDQRTRLDAYAWHKGNSGDKLHPVGQKLPNAFGLYDMLGNAREWCVDVWDEFAYTKPPQVRPNLALDASGVVRGGSIKDLARVCRSAVRSGDGTLMGFRVARDHRP